MILNLPDPHPGRCLNYREGRDYMGYPVPKRCLDYEGHDGRCRFQEDPAPGPRLGEGGIYVAPEPKAWVSPLGEPNDSEGPA